MTDKQKLEWIADHLVTFHPLISSATMVYINNYGEELSCHYSSDTPNPSNLELLEGCINNATK